MNERCGCPICGRWHTHFEYVGGDMVPLNLEDRRVERLARECLDLHRENRRLRAALAACGKTPGEVEALLAEV